MMVPQPGQRWLFRFEGREKAGTITKVRLRDVQVHWDDGANTWSVPKRCLLKQL